MCEIQILILFDQSVYSYMTRKSRIWCIQKHGLTPPTLLRLSALASASAPSRMEVAEKHVYRHPVKKCVRYSKQTPRSTVRYARRRAALPQPLCASMQIRKRRPKVFFSFLYLKKSKFQKYMSVSKNFENIPRSPAPRATVL